MKISRTSHFLELRAPHLWVSGRQINELWGSVKGWELLDELKGCQLLQQDFAVCSES